MRIVSWNIGWSRGTDGKVDPVRTVFTLRDLGEIDVICLQEVAQYFPGLEGGAGEDEVGILSAAFPRWECFFAPALDLPDGAGGRARFGNMIVSRLQVGQVLTHTLPSPADPERALMTRICQEVVVLTASGPVRVMNTHLEHASSQQRIAQIDALNAIQREASESARIAPHRQAPHPPFDYPPLPADAILCGDFNLLPGSEAYDRLVEAGWHDAWKIANAPRPHAPTVNIDTQESGGAPRCSDYFFVTEKWSSRVQSLEIDAGSRASDHQPIVLTTRDG